MFTHNTRVFLSWITLLSFSLQTFTGWIGEVHAVGTLTADISLQGGGNSVTQTCDLISCDTTVNFTVAFNNPVDISTVNAARFSTGGSTAPGLTIGNITPTNSSNGGLTATGFTVQVTTTGTGDIHLDLTSTPIYTAINSGGNGPYDLTKDSQGNLYVANKLSNNVARVGDISTPVLSTGDSPVFLYTQPGLIYTANFNNGSTTASALDTTNNSTGSFDIGQYPSGIAYANNNFYIANWTNGTVTRGVFNGTIFSGTTIIPVGINPILFTTPADPTSVYVANYGSGTVTKIYSDNTGITIPTGTGPRAISFGNNKIYVANFGSDNVYWVNDTDFSSGTISLGTGTNPYDITVDGSGYIYTANYGSGTVTKIHPNGTIIGTIPVGTNPTSLEIVNNVLYVANYTDNTVSIVPLDTIKDIVGTNVTSVTPKTITVNAAPISLTSITPTMTCNPSGPIFNVGSGTICTLTSSPVSNGTQSWSSSSGAIATVSSTGVVNFIAPGTVTITGSIAASGTFDSGSVDQTFTVSAAAVTDTFSPTVTLVGAQNISINPSPVGKYFDAGASWTDTGMVNSTLTWQTGNTLSGTSYGQISSFYATGKTINGAAISTFNVDTSGNTVSFWPNPSESPYTVTYMKVDAAGLTHTGTRTITVNTLTPATPVTPSSFTSMITLKSGQNATVNTTGAILYTVTFGNSIDPSTFTKNMISTGGSTASNIVINSITPQGGNSFDISVTPGGSGTVVLSVTGGVVPKTISNVAGTTTGDPWGVVTDELGNAYVTNDISHVITKIAPDGTATTLASNIGTGASRIVYASGYLYTANVFANTVSKISTGGVVNNYSGFEGPSGVAIDREGNLYVSEFGNGTYGGIKKALSGSSTFTRIFTGTLSMGGLLTNIDVGPDGNLYALITSTALGQSGNIIKFNTGGTQIGSAAVGVFPIATAFSKDGTEAYIANSESNNLIKINIAGAMSITANYPTGGNGAHDVIVDGSGFLYVPNYYSGTVAKMNTGGTIVSLIPTGKAPSGVALDGSGNVYVANRESNTITKISSATIRDTAGNYNAASNSATVMIKDTIAPVVTLNITTLTGADNSVYTDSGASWTDTGINSTITSGTSYNGIYGDTGSFSVTGRTLQNTNIPGFATGATTATFTLSGAQAPYTLTYKKVDAAGNSGTVTRIINVQGATIQDIYSPTVTGATTDMVVVNSNTSYNYASGVSWTDTGIINNVPTLQTGNALSGTVYGALNSFYYSGSVTMTQTGVYRVDYRKVDAAGNSGTLTRYVTVTGSTIPDTFDPTVALLGNNTATGTVGVAYVDSGAIWSDTGTDNQPFTGKTLDPTFTVTGTGPTAGGGTAAIAGLPTSGDSSTVAMFTPTIAGTYTLTYRKVDAVGRSGSSIIRTINVPIPNSPDQIPPTFAAPTAPQISGTIHSGVTITGGPIWTDTGVNNQISTGSAFSGTYGQLDSFSATGTAPGGGTITGFTLTPANNTITFTPTTTGTFVVTYKRVDAAGNSGTVIQNIVITNANNNPDILPPVVTLSGSATINNFLSGTLYTDSGASWTDTGVNNVGSGGTTLDSTFTVIGSANIINLSTANGIVTFTPTAAGAYTLTYKKVDANNNSGTVVRTINVVAPTAPVAPAVTADDTTNTVAGMTTAMEYNLDNAGYVPYNATTFAAINFAGNHTLLVRVAAAGINPAGAITTLNFATNPGSTNTNTITYNSQGGTPATSTQTVNSNTALGTLPTATKTGYSFSGWYDALSGGNLITTTTIPTGTTTYYAQWKDITPPVVTLSGSANIIIPVGTPYTEPGASWTDNADGTGNTFGGTYGNTGSFASTGTVNTTATGTYTIDYMKVDAAGNRSTIVQRTVTVTPIITLTTSITATGGASITGSMIQPGTIVDTNGYNILVTSTGGSLSISGTVDFYVTGGLWNGSLYAPTLSATGVLEISDAGVLVNLPSSTSTTTYTNIILPTYMAGGSGNVSVVASGGTFTLSMKVNGSVSSGQTIQIFRSADASTWTLNTPMNTCTLDMNLMCTFTTDHLSYFGFVRSVGTAVTTGGGGGTTGGTTGGSSQGVTGAGGGGGGTTNYTLADQLLTAVVFPNSNTQGTNTTSNTNTTTSSNIRNRTTSPNNSSLDSLIGGMFGDSQSSDNSDASYAENAPRPDLILGTAYVSVKSSLRVRYAPGFGSTVAAYLDRNQQIEVLDNDSPNWAHITYWSRDGKPHQGYIPTQYVRAMTIVDQIRDKSISFGSALLSNPELKGVVKVAHALNLRKGPSLNARIKAILSPNTQVIILDTVGKWYEILTEKYHGFVSSKYIRLLK